MCVHLIIYLCVNLIVGLLTFTSSSYIRLVDPKGMNKSNHICVCNVSYICFFGIEYYPDRFFFFFPILHISITTFVCTSDSSFSIVFF
jgi:hypothetical protein